MNIYDWLHAQIDIVRECVRILHEKRGNVDLAIIQLWALKKHVDAMIDYLERHRKYEPRN
jgi:hypothetical protein